MSPTMSFSQIVGYTRPAVPLPPPAAAPSQITRRSPSVSPPARQCCENGRQIITDPHTGQTICSCQYPAGLVAFPRVPGLPDGVYAPPFAHHQGLVPVGSDASAFYSPLANTPYDMKENVDAWRTIQQAGGCFTYDPSMALYPYPGYGGLDLNGARRKNATRETTTTLKHWLYEHRKNPYPTKGEKIMLAIITKMTLTQVSTWFANARRRLKKENKMTWTPRNRADDGLENGNNEESDVDIDDDLDEEDKEKLKRAGLFSPVDDKRDERLDDLDDRLNASGEEEGCGVSSQILERAKSAENSPIDMRKGLDDVIDSDCDDSEPRVKRRKLSEGDSGEGHENDVERDKSRSPVDRVRDVTPSNDNIRTISTDRCSSSQQTTPKIWSVSEFLNDSSSDSNKIETSPIITTQLQSLPSQTPMRPHCGMTLVPSPHGWVGCRLPIGYPLAPHTLPYQYALKQHLLARNLAIKPSTYVSHADLSRRGPSSNAPLFSPARDLDTLQGRLIIDKPAAPVAI